MRRTAPLLMVALLGLAGGMALPLLAQAADAASQEASAAKKKKGAQKKTTAPRVTAPGGSGESAAERSARLRRECKGRPNAGACSGYTD